MNIDLPLKEALTQCDKQPIHLISAIQPHGYLIAFNPVDRKIEMASENIALLFDKRLEDVLGSRIESYLTAEDVKFLLENNRQNSSDPTTTRIAGPSGNQYEALVYQSGGLIVVELDAATVKYNSTAKLAELQSLSKRFAEDLNAQKDLSRASKLLCRYIRDLTGLDRVMLYKFLPNWDGEVVAEDKTPEAHSFNRHRFPATDIPLPARQLYLRNRTRLIPNASAEAVRVFPSLNPITNSTFDMSPSKLRAVPSVHLEYLKNMGVVSSFSVAVVHEGQLWGLVACHGTKPTTISLSVRTSCEVLASTFVGLARFIESDVIKTKRLKFESTLRQLVQKVIVKSDPLDAFFRQHQDICEVFNSTGMALVKGDKVSIAGLTPPDEYLRALVPQLQRKFGAVTNSVMPIENLSDIDESWVDVKNFASGVLAVSLSALENSMFLLFRPEILNEVVWGGDPRKSLDKRNYQGPINPRLSFESWTQSVHNRSIAWESYEIEGVEYIRDVIFDGIIRRDQLIQELGRQLGHNTKK